ncbi:glycosyltransferase family 39 protein [Candidatus Woesearchaeota archaeon]|nr:glycosyltransferase family 39 protein [Candidatus Woesearchaeota archaeon]
MKKKNKRPEKHNHARLLFYASLLIIFVLAFIIRVVPLQTAHWWDETVYLQNAEVIYSGADNYDELNFRPPLLSVIFAIAFLIKHHVFTASIVVALLATLAPIFTFLIGRELYGRKTGLIAGIMMAFTPFIVENSRFIMTDVTSLSFICMGVYFLIIGSKSKENYQFILSGLFFSFAVLTRFTSLIILFIIPVYFLVQKIRWKDALPIGIGFGFGIVPYLVWSQITQGNFLKPFIVAQWMVTGANTTMFFYFSNFLKAYSFVVLFGLIIWAISTLLLFRVSTLKKSRKLIIATRIRLKKHLDKVDLVFLIWVLVFLAYMTFLVAHKELRYILPIALPVIILSARGISYITGFNNKTVRHIALILVILLGIGSFAPSFSTLSQPLVNTYQSEEMLASKFIRENYSEDSVIHTNHNYPVFAYYTKMKILKLEERDNTFYTVFPGNMEEDGLLIIYNGTKHPTKEWVDNNRHFRFVKEFQNIVIYEYNRR